MKVILLQDIENIGKKYDIKEVADGHARNFLIPKSLVKPATKQAILWAETQREILSQKAEEELKTAQGTASGVDGQEIIIPMKVGDEQQLFESITAQKISEKLKELGFTIKKTQIDLQEPIKELGEHSVKIKFEHNLEAEIRVVVVEEKENA